uniref:Uncharacterized protein n=1 Tax=Escherichia coli TaxID=562 RepID=A0A2R4PEK9_ECOLX|nr:hypothetical protein [Escherichia coli]
MCAFSLLLDIARLHLSRRAAFSISRGENKGVYERQAPLYFLPVGCKLPFAAQ